jgi:hypothetical protein
MLSPNGPGACQNILVAATIRIAEHVRDFNRYRDPGFYIGDQEK